MNRRDFGGAVLACAVTACVPSAFARRGRGAVSSSSSSFVTDYNALTNTDVYAEPVAPALGAANSTVTDPTFGTKILRVTDANTVSAYAGRSWYPNSGSAEECRWSAGDSRFLVLGEGGQEIVFDFDPAAPSATLHTFTSGAPVPGLSLCQWDAIDDDLLYGFDGNNVKSFRISTEASATVWNTGPLSTQGNFGDLGVAAGSGRMFIRLGPQDTATLCAAYDQSTAKQWVLDTTAGTVNGESVPFYVNGVSQSWISFQMHNVRAGMDGRYVMLTPNGATVGSYTNCAVVWDVDGGPVNVITTSAAGHNAAGYGRLVNNDYIRGAAYSAYKMLIRSVATETGIANPADLNSPPDAGSGDTYSSWVNNQPNVNMPVLWTTIDDGYTGIPPAVADVWQREICAIATDGSAKVWRFCHHFSWYNGFYDGVHATVSRSGKYALFGSSWQYKLGIDSDSPQASFTASIDSAGLMTVSAVGSGTLGVDAVVTGPSVPNGTIVTSLGTGAGSAGTYNTNCTVAVASESMAAGANRDDCFIAMLPVG